MEGDLSLLSIPDLLQMICLGGYNRDIHLFDGPTQLGVIAIRNGRVDRCFGFGTWGEAAFYKLIQLRRGRYKVNDAQDMSASDASLTAHSWQELLMEAARQQDEADRVLQSSVTGRVIAFPSPAPHAITFDPPATLLVAAPAAPAAFPRAPSVPPIEPSASPDSGPVVIVVADHASAATSHPDLSELLAQATACYLRRDLARAEELLHQYLALRPNDKRALQNLECIRRKKSP